MIGTNEERLVRTSALAEVQPQASQRNPYNVSQEGEVSCVPAPGGIVYNVRTGDSAYGWVADHLEPGASVYNPKDEENNALQFLVCVGNEARVVSGEAKGETGLVVGTHACGDYFASAHFDRARVIVDFPWEILEKLVYGDKVLIRLVGKGLAFTDYPAIKTDSISPRLVEAMGLEDGPGGKLRVPVVARVPPALMGSGVGFSAEFGDYDIMSGDREALAENGLDELRLGDFVAIMDHDARYGRSYRRGAATIGVVVHGDCRLAGHGPGVSPLFTAVEPVIEPVIDTDANLAVVLSLREDWEA
jgi:hypothetical protein